MVNKTNYSLSSHQGEVGVNISVSKIEITRLDHNSLSVEECNELMNELEIIFPEERYTLRPLVTPATDFDTLSVYITLTISERNARNIGAGTPNIIPLNEIDELLQQW